jgi:hypothetical protein
MKEKSGEWKHVLWLVFVVARLLPTRVVHGRAKHSQQALQRRNRDSVQLPRRSELHKLALELCCVTERQVRWTVVGVVGVAVADCHAVLDLEHTIEKRRKTRELGVLEHVLIRPNLDPCCVCPWGRHHRSRS